MMIKNVLIVDDDKEMLLALKEGLKRYQESFAVLLAEDGLKVRLLEAETIGYGGSGRNVGLVNAGLWLEPEKVESALGAERGRPLNDALAAGPDLTLTTRKHVQQAGGETALDYARRRKRGPIARLIEAHQKGQRSA